MITVLIVVIALLLFLTSMRDEKSRSVFGSSATTRFVTPHSTRTNCAPKAKCSGCRRDEDCPYFHKNLWACQGNFPEAERVTNKEYCERRGGIWARMGGCNANGQCSCPYPTLDTTDTTTGEWTPCDPRPNGTPICVPPIDMMSGEIRDSRPYQFNYGYTYEGNPRPLYVGNAHWRPSYSHCFGPRPHYVWSPDYATASAMYSVS